LLLRRLVAAMSDLLVRLPGFFMLAPLKRRVCDKDVAET
jgi:hypothetical protein